MDNKAKKILQDILEAINSVDEHLQGKRNFNLYLENKTMRRSVEREIEIMGEAMKNLLRIEPNIPIISSK